MKYLFRLILVVLFAALSLAAPAHAQTPNYGSYPAGWNMVGGPPGTDFSSAAIVWAYSNGYFNPNTKSIQDCHGFWVYFDSPTTVQMSPLAIGPAMPCTLLAGWNLVSNPFAGVAPLPAGTMAYHWNPSQQTYDRVTDIPVGGADWIYSPSGGPLFLTYQATSAPPAQTLVVNGVQPGPYTVHVGDSVKLVLPSAVPYTATADPTYLHLDAAGLSGPMDCVNDPQCNITLVDRFWEWHAVAPGTTTITVACTNPGTQTACQTPSNVITVNIVS